MSGNPKNKRKRLILKEQLEVIEDSLKPDFKQSKAALKWGLSPGCLHGILKRKNEILNSRNKSTKKSMKCEQSNVQSTMSKFLEQWNPFFHIYMGFFRFS